MRTYAPDAIPPDQALERLREGNRRFVAGEGNAYRNWHPGLVEGQSPFAVVLGCSDSRAPVEYVFDQGLGELFVIRVAGNIVAPSLVGSIEFATSQFGTRLVVVMGHTQCGAVGATVRALQKGGPPASTNLQSIVNRIKPHIQHLYDDEDQPKSSASTDVAVAVNARMSAAELRYSSQHLEELVSKGRVVIAPCVYDLATGVVTFLDE